MIDGVLAVFGFLLGLFLCVQLIGAVYSIIDFQEDLQRYWPTVVGRIGGWLIVYAVLLSLLPISMEAALVAGSRIMLGFHLLFIFLPSLLWLLFRYAEEKGYRKFLDRLN